MMRIGLRNLLEKSRQFTVCAECANARTALARLRGDHPSLAILDITLPGGLDGIELIKCMVSESPTLGILVFSVHDEALYALRSIAAGAKGYLMKGTEPKTMLQALQTIRDGGVAVSAGISQRLVQRAVGHTASASACGQATDHLSDRELEVLSWIGKGISTQQIATLLGISTKTVETHRAHLKQKLALKSAFELYRYAVAWRFSEGHHHDSLEMHPHSQAEKIRGQQEQLVDQTQAPKRINENLAEADPG